MIIKIAPVTHIIGAKNPAKVRKSFWDISVPDKLEAILSNPKIYSSYTWIVKKIMVKRYDIITFDVSNRYLYPVFKYKMKPPVPAPPITIGPIKPRRIYEKSP